MNNVKVKAAQVFGPEVLQLDYPAEIERIAVELRNITAKVLRKRGLVVAISGGIDSSTCLGLAVRALGPDRVFALLLPETDSSDDSARRATILARHLGVRHVTENIASTLDAIGCYRRRDEAINRVLPAYDSRTWKMKIVLRGGLEGRINHFMLVTQNPAGQIEETRLPAAEYLQIVAATNFKQRIRKTMEYYYADQLNYGVVGTPNLLEYDQGFFVKNGDGSADVKPIAHLYKTQVYETARALGLPAECLAAIPTTDTYSLAQGQDEFYFALPYKQMDLALWAFKQELPAETLAASLGLSAAQAQYVYDDIVAKRRAAAYLGAPPVLVEKKS